MGERFRRNSLIYSLLCRLCNICAVTTRQNENYLLEKFSGCLLGGMIGDVIGAAVEAETPGYIQKTFRNLDEIVTLKSVPELFSGEWEVGRFTDDTQMSICVAEWLIADEAQSGKNLLKPINSKRVRMQEPNHWPTQSKNRIIRCSYGRLMR